MKKLNFDLQTLNEDIDIVLALESKNVPIYDPTMVCISNRWGITVATETNPFIRMEAPKEIARLVGRGAGKLTGKAANAALNGAGKTLKYAGDKTVSGSKKLSSKLIDLLGDFLVSTKDRLKDKVAENLDKTNRLEKEVYKLEDLINRSDFTITNIPANNWITKVCVEDKLNLDACFNFNKYVSDVDKIYNDVTVRLKRFKNDIMLDKPTGFTTLSKSSSWAVKRSAGLLGIAKNGKYNAVCLPGNIIYTIKKGNISDEVVNFGIAYKYDGGSISSLSLEDSKHALKACNDLINFLKDRAVHYEYKKGVRDVGSYSGIYTNAEELKKEIEDSKESGESRTTIRIMIKQLQNLITVEDAITTSAVRVCEGLIKYIKLSAKKDAPK